jgi:hypothetical protein
MVATRLSEVIPELPKGVYQQLTENINVGELINELGFEGYISMIGNGTEQQQYNNQLLAKLKTETPAKLPYVIAILAKNEMDNIYSALRKNKASISENQKSLAYATILSKYSELIK